MKVMTSTKSKGLNKHYCIPCKLSRKKCSKQLPTCDQCKSISFCCQYPEEESHLKIRFYQNKAADSGSKKRSHDKTSPYPQPKHKQTSDNKTSQNKSPKTNEARLPTNSAVNSFIHLKQATPKPDCSPQPSTIPYNFIENPQLLHAMDSLTLIQNLFTPPNSEPDSKCDMPSSPGIFDCFKRGAFWDELVELFLNQFHSFQPIFDMSYFNPRALSEACQSVIHCIGYHFKEDKCYSIVQYLVKRAEISVKTNLFQCTLMNTQTITLLSTYYLLTRDYKRSNAYLNLAIRLGYTLGLDHATSARRYEAQLTWSFISLLSVRISGINLTYYNVAVDNNNSMSNPIRNNIHPLAFIHESPVVPAQAN